MQLLRRLLISCRRYTELVCRECHEQLDPVDKTACRIHSIICLVCRRFERQVRAMNLCAHKVDHLENSSDQRCLSPETRRRIQSTLDRELASPTPDEQ